MSSFEQIQLGDGTRGFRKFLPAGHSECFLAEAQSLAALAHTGVVRTPQVIAVDSTQLVTQYLERVTPGEADWQRLARELAALHSISQGNFGFERNNFCGDTPQPNTPCEDGFIFFAENRLLYQGKLARDAGLIEAATIMALERLCQRLHDYIPLQPPALLHGDLWSGNVVFCASGPHLIDPACYRGWPEADLAMTSLFGGFSSRFYQAYREARPLAPGFTDRAGLYNLYHLLNHLNLFGSGYHAQVMAMISCYS